MTVVAGVLLDHVVVDPPQRARAAVVPARFVEAASGRRPPGRLALALPHRQVRLPVGVVERIQLGVLAGVADPDPRQLRLGPENAPEPVALDLGHVTHQPVQGERRRRHRSHLALRVVEPLALEEQRGPVELEPGFEHGPLGQDVGGLPSAGVDEISDHDRTSHPREQGLGPAPACRHRSPGSVTAALRRGSCRP